MSDDHDPRFGPDPRSTRPIPPVPGGPAGGSASPGGPGWERPVYGTAPQPGPAGAQHDGGPAVVPVGGGAPGRRRFGAGTLVTGMVLAALVGAGTAVGTGALTDGGQLGTADGTTPRSIIVNDQDAVNAVTAAAQKASASVVTISVAGGSQSGEGSGVVLDDQGHILTNTHVVTLDGTAGTPVIEVQLDDGSVHPATVVGTDPDSDLAVIKIAAQGLTPASLGSTGDLNVGDTVIAIGAPLGLSGTVTDGIVSTLERTIAVASSAAPDTPPEGGGNDRGGSDFFFDFPGGGDGGPSQQAKKSVYLNVVQTDAAINPGNSGGPLVDTDGNVVGINVAIASAGSSSSSAQAGNIGVGFSIPVDHAKRVAQELIDHGRATHGYLGTSVGAAPAADGKSRAFSDGAGVRDVAAGSPADEAGLRKGDVITGFNGHRIQDATSLTAAVRELPAGGTGTVTFRRDGKERSAQVTVTDAADQR